MGFFENGIAGKWDCWKMGLRKMGLWENGTMEKFDCGKMGLL